MSHPGEKCSKGMSKNPDFGPKTEDSRGKKKKKKSSQKEFRVVVKAKLFLKRKF